MNLLIIKNNLNLTFEQLGWLYFLLKEETKQDGTFSKSSRDLGDEFNCGYDKVQRFLQTLEKNNVIYKTQQDKFSTPTYKWNTSILSGEQQIQNPIPYSKQLTQEEMIQSFEQQAKYIQSVNAIQFQRPEQTKQQQVEKQPKQPISSELQLVQQIIPCVNQQMLDIIKKTNNTLLETQKYFKLCFNIDLTQEQYNSIRNILDLPLNYIQENNSENQLI